MPVAQPFLDFYKQFAGYVFDCGLELGVLGLIHPESPWRPPYEVDAWSPSPPDYPLWRVQAVDVNPTFYWVIDEEGTYYTAANVKIAGSFARFVEQLAYWAEFTERTPVWTGDVAKLNPAGVIAREFLPRLEPYRLPELSDAYSAVYATPDWAVWMVNDLDCLDLSVREGANPPELTGLRWGGNQHL